MAEKKQLTVIRLQRDLLSSQNCCGCQSFPILLFIISFFLSSADQSMPPLLFLGMVSSVSRITTCRPDNKWLCKVDYLLVYVGAIVDPLKMPKNDCGGHHRQWIEIKNFCCQAALYRKFMPSFIKIGQASRSSRTKTYSDIGSLLLGLFIHIYRLTNIH